MNKNDIEKLSAKQFLSHLFSDFLEADLHLIPVADGKRPDFYDKKHKILGEIKGIHEKSENDESARWSIIVNNIKNEILKDPNFKKLKALYSVSSPRNLNIPREKQKECANKILEAIKSKSDKANYSDYEFGIKKYPADTPNIVFAGFGNVRSIDPAGIINANIGEKIIIADQQLKYEEFSAEKRIVLLVNRVYMGSMNDIVKALALMYPKLLQLENIDEIWVQNEIKGVFHHELIYSKDFIHAFENKTLKPISNEHISLFEKWYWALDELPNKKENILDALKKFLDKNLPYVIFKNEEKRESMVKFGEYLLKIDDIKNAKWLINKFINDPDPSRPEEYIGKPEFNYHEKIKSNQEVEVITTVQGHLAWLVKEFSRKSSVDDITNLVYAFDLVKEKLTDENQNLYMVLEWIMPLIEIANRRMWIAKNNPDKYREFRALVIDQKKGLISKYARYKEIRRALVHLMNYFKDITDKEALFVVRRLLDSPESDVILVYFALFRERHYRKDQEAGKIFGKISPEILNYSSKKLQKLLREILTGRKHYELRIQTAWQFWKILKDNPEEFCFLLPWINLLFYRPYNRELFSNLELIIEDWYGRDTPCENLSHKWLINYIKSVTSYSRSNFKNEIGRRGNVWISVDNLLAKIAQSHPEDLSKVVAYLYEIWKNYGFIGDLELIFNSYKFIEDEKLRTKTLNKFRNIYIKMKSLKRDLKPINF